MAPDPNLKYRLNNIAGGTYMTIVEETSIRGEEYDTKLPQLWTFEQLPNGKYYIKSAQLTRSQRFLAAPDNIVPGSDVVASVVQYQWEVRDRDGMANGLAIMPAGATNYGVELSNGSPKPGTPVVLKQVQGGGYNQCWLLEQDRCA